MNLTKSFAENPTESTQGVIVDYNKAVGETLEIIRASSHLRMPGKVDRDSQNALDEILRLIGLQFITEHISNDTKLVAMENQEIKSFLANIPRETTKSILAQLINSEKLSFPFKKYFVMPADQLFANLQAYQPVITSRSFYPNGCKIYSTELFPFTFNGKYTVLANVDANYDTIDVIADHFTEAQRMNAVRADQPQSPMNYWKINTIRVSYY